MTRNERISEWFEPLPTKHPVGMLNEGIKCASGDTWNGTKSPKRCWYWDGRKWVAIRWDTDEEANARLLEAMPEPILMKELGQWSCDPDGDNDPESVKFSKDRKTAVVKAFCAFANIPYEETK